MRILFIAQARMGDVCCAIPAYLALRSAHRKAHIMWQVVGQYSMLLPDSVDEIIRLDGPTGINRPARNDFDKMIMAQPMFRHKEWERSKMHIIDLVAKWSGVKLPAGKRQIKIKIPQEAKDKVDLIAVAKKKFVAICCSPCYSAYNWDYKIRKMVVNEVKRLGLRVVAIGGKDGKDIGGKQWYGKLNPLETIELISRSKGYIGPDNGTSWLACAAQNVPKVMLIDKNRLKQGVTGFANYLDDKNIQDYFYNEIKPNQIASKLIGMMR